MFEPEVCERMSKNLKHKMRQTFQSTEVTKTVPKLEKQPAWCNISKPQCFLEMYLLYFVTICLENQLQRPSTQIYRQWLIFDHLLLFQMRRFKTTEEIDMDDEDIEFIVQQVLYIKQFAINWSHVSILIFYSYLDTNMHSIHLSQL